MVTAVGAEAKTRVHGPVPVTEAPVRAASIVAADASNARAPVVVPSTVRVNVPPVAVPTDAE